MGARMRRPMIAFLFAAAVVSFAVGAKGDDLSAVQTALPDFDSYMIMRVGGSAPVAVSADEAADALKNYDVIFIGELHDDIANHLAEMALLRALYARTPKLALSMEQFERDVQPVVDDYLAGRIGEETLRDKGRAWKNYAEAYRPLVEFAKDHGLAVIAANAPESVVRCVAQKGVGFLKTLPADKRGWVAKTLHTQDGPYKRKFIAFLSGDAAHGGSADGVAARVRAKRSFAAQVTRDDTMASSIARFLGAHPGTKVVHVTGEFHVAGRLGTIARLKMRRPDLKIALVVPVEAKDPDAPKMTADQAPGADFAILLRPEPQAYVSDQERKAAEKREAAQIRAAMNKTCKL